MKQKLKKETTYVRRGFDIDFDLYQKMRLSVVNTGIRPKIWLKNAIARYLGYLATEKGKKHEANE